MTKCKLYITYICKKINYIIYSGLFSGAFLVIFITTEDAMVPTNIKNENIPITKNTIGPKLSANNPMIINKIPSIANSVGMRKISF